jgi:hypothetical protein
VAGKEKISPGELIMAWQILFDGLTVEGQVAQLQKSYAIRIAQQHNEVYYFCT